MISAKDEQRLDFFQVTKLMQNFLYSITIYMLHYNPQHVSSSTLLILRRTNCIITASQPLSTGALYGRDDVRYCNNTICPPEDEYVATFGKILGDFSPIVPPSAAGVRWRRWRRGGHLVAGVGTF